MWTLEDAYNLHTDEKDVADVSRKAFFSSGRTNLKIKRIVFDQVPAEKEDGTPTKTPNRPIVKLGLVGRNSEGKDVWLNLALSPEAYREYLDENGEYAMCKKGHEAYTPTNKHDKKFRAWVAFENLINPTRESMSVGQIIDNLKDLEINVFVGLRFVDLNDPQSKGIFANGENIDHYLEDPALEPSNYIKFDGARLV